MGREKRRTGLGGEPPLTPGGCPRSDAQLVVPAHEPAEPGGADPAPQARRRARVPGGRNSPMARADRGRRRGRTARARRGRAPTTVRVTGFIGRPPAIVGYSTFIRRLSGTPSAFAMRSSSGTSRRVTGRRSRREMVGCGTPAARASSTCDHPLRSRSRRIRSSTGVTGQVYGTVGEPSMPLRYMLLGYILPKWVPRQEFARTHTGGTR